MQLLNKKAIIFAPEIIDYRLTKRIQALEENGFKQVCFAYYRKRDSKDIKANYIRLATVKDKSYFLRIIKLASALLVVYSNRDKLQNTDLFYAINLDLAFLAYCTKKITGSNAPIIYEVADVMSVMLSKNILGHLLRFIEKIILKKTQTLVVTSPAYIKHYFGPTQTYNGSWFLLENKLFIDSTKESMNITSTKASRLNTPKNTWTIGYFGALRCTRSLSIIKNIVESLPNNVTFYIRGYLMDVDENAFENLLQSHKQNVIFNGTYKNPNDLPEMHEKIDFVWTFDFQERGTHSKWILPNRLYEGGFFEVPMLGPKGFETGNFIEKHKIGWTFDEPYSENIIKFLTHLKVEEYLKIKSNYKLIPKVQFASKKDFAVMCQSVLEIVKD